MSGGEIEQHYEHNVDYKRPMHSVCVCVHMRACVCVCVCVQVRAWVHVCVKPIRCALSEVIVSFQLQGGETMVPFITAHKIKVTQEDLRIVLSEANPLTSSLSQLAQQSIKQHCMHV